MWRSLQLLRNKHYVQVYKCGSYICLFICLSQGLLDGFQLNLALIVLILKYQMNLILISVGHTLPTLHAAQIKLHVSENQFILQRINT